MLFRSNMKNLSNPWLMDHKRDVYMPMGQTAEIVAERYKVSREKQDEMALASQKRTAAFQSSGKAAEEISPMKATMLVVDKATGERKPLTSDNPYFMSEEFMQERWLLGTPAEIAARIAHWQPRLGMDHLIFTPRPPGMGLQIGRAHV